jgi:hypothetical protein
MTTMECPLSAGLCCKSPKMPCDQFFAKRQNKRQPFIDVGSLRLTSDTDVASTQISLMASLETDACKLWLVKGRYVCPIHHRQCTRVPRLTSAQIAALVSSGDSGIANQLRGFSKTETALLLQRTITPRFSGQLQAWPDQQMVAIAASLACPMRFNFWTQICLPTQFILGVTAWGRVRLSVLGY